MSFFKDRMPLRAYFACILFCFPLFPKDSLMCLLLTHTNAHAKPLITEEKRTSPAFKDVVDLPQQQGHVTKLRLPGLTEHLQVLLCDLTGRVEGQRLGSRHDLSGKCAIMRKVSFK